MPRTADSESGLLLTPTTQDNPQVRGVGKTVGTSRGTTLGGYARMWATPDASQRGSRAADLVKNGSTVERRGSGQLRGIDLQTQVKMWPTPVQDDVHFRKQKYNQGGTALSTKVGGQLNPQWVEWLMGYPEGWTDLEG